MRKTFLLSAVAVAASVVLLAPAAAAVADDAVPVSASSRAAQAPTVSITSVPDVRPAPKPAPVAGRSELALSRYGGPAGKQVAITLTGSGSPRASCWVRSQAFVGGKVKLAPGSDGKWHGTATVAKTGSGPYTVAADCGADPARFWVEAE